MEERARSFTAWIHVVALLYAQLTHALSLNEVCDGLRLWATPPSRNGLSHANKVRDCAMAEALFWAVLGHLQASFARFGQGATRGKAWRLRRTIHAVDATVIQLMASCLEWARHQRRKAAAKCHLRLNLRGLLPQFVLVSATREPELAHARQVCACLRAGEIVLFDRGYHNLVHFWELTQRGVFFVTRPKTGLHFKVLRCWPKPA